MIEIWKSIPGFEGRYEASSFGRIKSLPNSRRSTELVLKQRPNTLRGNYMCVGLTGRRDGQLFQRGYHVHALVCLAFHGLPGSPDLEACHNDGDNRNNAPSNVRWDTHRNNLLDRNEHGTSNRGARNAMAVLTEEKARAVKGLLGTISQKKIAVKFGVGRSTVAAISQGRTWSYV